MTEICHRKTMSQENQPEQSAMSQLPIDSAEEFDRYAQDDLLVYEALHPVTDTDVQQVASRLTQAIAREALMKGTGTGIPGCDTEKLTDTQ